MNNIIRRFRVAHVNIGGYFVDFSFVGRRFSCIIAGAARRSDRVGFKATLSAVVFLKESAEAI